MNTQQLLKKVGIGIAAWAVLLILGTPAWAGTRVFTFVSFSQAATINPGTPTEVVPRVGMVGSGTFDVAEGEVQGGGTFVLFNNSSTVPKPKPIILTGKWVATKIVSYTNKDASGVPFGSYDHIQSAILVLRIDLHLDNGAVISGATLTIICNIGAAGADTGQPEGYKLTIPGTSFGEFTPVLVPNAAGGMTPLGISHLSTQQPEQEDDSED